VDFGREKYTVIASQVQKDIRVSLIQVARQSSIAIPGRKGIEIGIIVEGFGEPVSKKMFPWFPISEITWKDDKGRTSSNFRGTPAHGRVLSVSPKGVSARWEYLDSFLWPKYDFSKSAKYLTVEYRLFIYPDRRYSFVFQNIPIK